MARKSKWDAEDRKRLYKMVKSGKSEQEIREHFGGMSSSEFAQQLKMAMVEAGYLKQSPRKSDGKSKKQRVYTVTSKGRLTISDFSEVTGMGSGARFVLEKPRGRSQAWRLLPYEEDAKQASGADASD